MPKKPAKTYPSKKALEQEISKLKKELREARNQAEMSGDLEQRAFKKHQELSEYPNIAYVLAYLVLKQYTIPELLAEFDLIYEQECHEGGVNVDIEKALSATLSSVVEDMTRREH